MKILTKEFAITYFTILFFWLIDFITTFIFLSTNSNLDEANPIMRYFFSFGLYGWILALISTPIFLFLTTYFMFKAINHTLDRTPKLKRKKRKLIFNIAYITYLCLFCIAESITILSNIILFIKNL